MWSARGGLPTPRFVLLSNNICLFCPYSPSNGLFIGFQIELFYTLSPLILCDNLVYIFELPLVKILFGLLNRKYRVKCKEIIFNLNE